MKNTVLNSTIDQIKHYSDIYSFDSIETVYIGGGTPTVLSPVLLEKLFAAVSDTVNSQIKEFSIEINPETVNQDIIDLIKNSPLTRLSTGIQTFDDKFLKILGRNCKSDISRKAVDKLLSTGRILNLDLISSIPGQKINDSIKDIKAALTYNPHHISLYSLTLEKNTPIAGIFTQDDINDDVWIESSEYLEKSGFNHYEISNFAIPGYECAHNMNYWKMKSYIGCGPSAVSTALEDNTPYRISNTSDISLFLEGKVKNWNSNKEKIEKEDFFIETLMMGFRTSEGIDIENINRRFGTDIDGIIPKTVLKWKNKGLLIKKKGSLALTGKGRLFHSSFLIDIMNELENRKTPLS